MLKRVVFFCFLLSTFCVVHCQDDDSEFVAAPAQAPVASEKLVDSNTPITPSDTSLPELPAAPKTNYYMEIGYILLIAGYIAHWFNGRKANDEVAKGWILSVGKTFQSNFTTLGENGKGSVVKETQNEYRYNAYGRQNIAGFLARLKLRKRHDLFYTIIETFSGSDDIVEIDIALEGNMQPFVFAIVPKSEEKKYRKKTPDGKFLTFQTRPESLEKLSVFAEHEDLAFAFMTPEAMKILAANSDILLRLHISDQALLSTQKRHSMRVELKLPTLENMSKFDAMLKLIIRFADIAETLKLSPAALNKSEKARAQAVADKHKEEHEKRQERAQNLKTEKLKKEKEKVAKMSSAEQAKYEEKQKKKEQKKRMARMKVVVG